MRQKSVVSGTVKGGLKRGFPAVSGMRGNIIADIGDQSLNTGACRGNGGLRGMVIGSVGGISKFVKRAFGNGFIGTRRVINERLRMIIPGMALDRTRVGTIGGTAGRNVSGNIGLVVAMKGW